MELFCVHSSPRLNFAALYEGMMAGLATDSYPDTFLILKSGTPLANRELARGVVSAGLT